MSVAIYMFRCMQSTQRPKTRANEGGREKEKRRRTQMKRMKEEKRCGSLLTPHALHLLCMGSRFNTEHRTNVRTHIHAHTV